MSLYAPAKYLAKFELGFYCFLMVHDFIYKLSAYLNIE